MKRRTFFWIKVAVGMILLGIIFYVVEPKGIWTAFKEADYRLVALGAILMPLNLWLQAYKWRYLVHLVHPEATTLETTGSLLGGFAFGIVTPGRIGEYSRALFIKNVRPLKLVGLTVVDKFYSLGCTFAFGLVALLTLPWIFKLDIGGWYTSIMILVGIVNVFLLFLALDPRPVRSLIYALQMLIPRRGKIPHIAGGLDRFNAPQARITLGLTLAHYVVFLLQYFFLICGFEKIDFISSSRAAAAILFGKSALPIAIGDLGIDQFISMQFFGEFGISDAAAVNASLLLFALNVLVPALAGVPFISRLQIGSSKLDSQ